MVILLNLGICQGMNRMQEANEDLYQNINHLMEEAERAVGSCKWMLKIARELKEKCTSLEKENSNLKRENKFLKKERDKLFDEIERLENGK